MSESDFDRLQYEDAFIADEDGWIDLPGGEGRVSPSGIVYDKNGQEIYSLYEESSVVSWDYLGTEDYEWI